MSDQQNSEPNPRVPAVQERADSARGHAGQMPRPEATKREAPARPPLTSANAAPVVAKVSPPASVRFAQLLWILSFFVGGFVVVYFFIIREDQLPVIADIVRGTVESRSDEAYDTAADIIFWSVFAVMLALLLAQIVLLVSFMGRRPGIRWWQLSTFIAQTVLMLLSLELISGGTDGEFLRQLIFVQLVLVLLGLLISTLPGALAWTARGVDVRRGPIGGVSGAGEL